MTTPFFSLGQLDSVYRIERDWLFEKHLGKLNAHRHLILTAGRGWGLHDYVLELGFQLVEKHPDIHIVYMDMKPARSMTSFLELFATVLSQRFPGAGSSMELDKGSTEVLRLPALIAKREKIRVAVFLANSHLFHRFKDPIPFLRTFTRSLKNQRNCIFCLYGNNDQQFRNLVHYPGPLSGMGQLFELKHNPLDHRSASIRKLFHDQDKKLGYITSNQMSYMVENHPFYLKLLAWHALIRTRQTCTLAIVEDAMSDLIRHFDHQFRKIVEDLTTKQLGFLKALIEGKQKLYSSAMRDGYQLGSTSNIARIKSSLGKKGIINKRSSEYVFEDPVFKEWLRRHYFTE